LSKAPPLGVGLFTKSTFRIELGNILAGKREFFIRAQREIVSENFNAQVIDKE